MQVQLQLVLDLYGLGDASREGVVGVAPLVPDLRRRDVDQVLRVWNPALYNPRSIGGETLAGQGTAALLSRLALSPAEPRDVTTSDLVTAAS